MRIEWIVQFENVAMLFLAAIRKKQIVILEKIFDFVAFAAIGYKGLVAIE